MSRGNRLYRRLAVMGLATGAVFTALPAMPAAAVARTITDSCGGAPNTVFQDEGSNNAEINNAADCNAAFGVLQGKNADASNPAPEIDGTANLTRSQTASLVVRLAAKAGFALAANPPDKFDDDNNVEDAIELEINQAAAAEFIEGKNLNNANGTNAAANVFPDYFPNDNVTRGQMIAIIVRMLEKVAPNETPNSGSHTFPDVPASHPFNAEIGIADDLGLIQGGADGRLQPDNFISRGQAIVIFARVIDFLVESGKLAPLAGSAGVITAFDNANMRYTFSQNNVSTVVTYDDTNDTYFVDGVAASRAAFQAAISVGDEISFTDDTTAGAADADVHRLTNINPANRRSGLVGNVDTGATTFEIIDQATGVTIGGPHNYAGDILQIAGATVSQATFAGAINEGDTVVGTRASDGTETWNLTNVAFSGTVREIDLANDQVGLNGTEGNSIIGDDPVNAQNDLYDWTDNSTFTIGGEARTQAQFEAALTQGDTLVVSRNGNAQVFALTNVPPPATTGVLTDVFDTTLDTMVLAVGANDAPIDYSAITSAFRVNGVTVTEAEFEAALTQGDSVTYTPNNPDTAADEEAIALTNANLTGSLDDIDTVGNTYDVENPQGNVIDDDLNYTAGEFGGPDRYFRNDVEINLAQFETLLGKIAADATPDDTITVIDNNSGIGADLSTDHKLQTDETL